MEDSTNASLGRNELVYGEEQCFYLHSNLGFCYPLLCLASSICSSFDVFLHKLSLNKDRHKIFLKALCVPPPVFVSL